MPRMIDAHMHLGEDLIYGSDDSEDVILGYMNEFAVDGVILQPGLKTHNWRNACMRIRDFAQANPGRAWGIVSHTPHCSEDTYLQQVSWAVRELGFVGIKLHPEAYACPSNAPQAEKVYRAARALQVPVMIHTGNGVPAALPSLAIPPALAYPDVTFVLAHAGGGLFGREALVAAQVCKNIYLETSWCNVNMIQKFIEQIGCERVMFGSDLPVNFSVEREKYRALHLPEETLAWCLGRTAETVFSLQVT